jgi:predicted MFS family arabinose efflux permease
MGCVITTIGLWIRVFADHGFAYIFAGHIVAATAQSFFYGTGQKVSAIWFPQNERGMATFFIMSLMTVGNAVGPLFPEFYIDPNAEGEVLMSQLKQMLLCTAYIGTGITAIVALFFKEKPLHPPSKIAEIPRLNYKRSLMDSLKNWNLMWAMLTMSTAAGVSIAWISCMEPMLKPLGVSQSQISYLLSVVMGVGFVVSLITSFFISKSRKYKFWIFIFGFIANFFLLGIIFSAHTQNSFLICALLLLSMVIGGAPGSMLFEFFVEISFPVAEEVPGSLYSLGYQLIGTGISLGVDHLVQEGSVEKSIEAIYVCFGVTVVALVGFLFVKEDLRRKRCEMGEAAEKNVEKKIQDETNQTIQPVVSL